MSARVARMMRDILPMHPPMPGSDWDWSLRALASARKFGLTRVVLAPGIKVMVKTPISEWEHFDY